MLLMNLKMRATVKLSQAGPGMFIPIDESIKLQFAQLNQTLQDARKTIKAQEERISKLEEVTQSHSSTLSSISNKQEIDKKLSRLEDMVKSESDNNSAQFNDIAESLHKIKGEVSKVTRMQATIERIDQKIDKEVAASNEAKKSVNDALSDILNKQIPNIEYAFKDLVMTLAGQKQKGQEDIQDNRLLKDMGLYKDKITGVVTSKTLFSKYEEAKAEEKEAEQKEMMKL